MKQHSPRFLQLVQDVKSRIREIAVEALRAKLDHHEKFYLIDVRESNEYLSGHILAAIALSKGVIERDIEKNIPDTNVEIVVYCSGGFRAALVVDNLQKMGYTNVSSLAGGFSAWQEAGFPIQK